MMKGCFNGIGASNLCSSKQDGALVLRNMEVFDDVLLAKQVRPILKDEMFLMATLLMAKDYPLSSTLQAKLGARPSYTWHSICGAEGMILEVIKWLIVNGELVNVWTDRWLPGLLLFRLYHLRHPT